MLIKLLLIERPYYQIRFRLIGTAISFVAVLLAMMLLNSDYAWAQEGSTDYGDLPVTYMTVGRDAPGHILVAEDRQIFLGDNVDGDGSGQPDEHGLGDLGDEEGILVLDTFSPGAQIAFDAIVNGAVSADGALLGSWFDWNHDGLFDETEYAVFSVVKGPNRLTVTVPAYYETTNLSARFRLFSSATATSDNVINWQDYAGIATNGEIEDYVFTAATAVTLRNVSLLHISSSTMIVTLMLLLTLLTFSTINKTPTLPVLIRAASGRGRHLDVI